MSLSRKKVLWVDDEIEFLRSHIMFLETRGYSVTPVFNGEDAIQMLSKKPNEFDIVLLDEQMPGKGGLATLVEIKELDPGLPVVMVTKSEEEQLMEDALGRNIDGYLTKPVNPSQILLVCKRLLHSKEIVSNQLKQEFVRNYSHNRDVMLDRLNAGEWMAFYQNLVEWDLKLEDTHDEGIRQAHVGQKSDANAHFADFVSAEYMKWMRGEGDPPLLSPQVMDTHIMPLLRSGEHVCFVVLDSMRLDQYVLFQKILKRCFSIENHRYYSILPTTAEFARHALFAGMYPLEISKKYPEFWHGVVKNSDDRNNNERELLENKLAAEGFDAAKVFEYQRLVDESDAQEIIDNAGLFIKKQFVTLVVDFIDRLIRGQAISDVLQDIVPDDLSFRKMTSAWFERSNLFKMFQTLADQGCTVVFTTSGGSNLCTRGTEYYGTSCLMESLRYRYGERVTCDERFAFFMHEPERFNLPQDTPESSCVILRENFYFVNHDTYRHYNEQYQNTFQRGGISMEEMIVPLAIMHPKAINL